MKVIIFIFSFIMVFSNVFAKDKIVRLTSLDWKPYTGADLPHGGVNTYIVKDIFKKLGYELKVEFLPWNRTLEYAKNNPKYDGYFPEYYDQKIEEYFLFSKSIGRGPVGLAHREDVTIIWDKLEDLADIQIGTVQGYVNTAEFDNLVAKGVLTTDPVVSDTINLMKIGAKRIKAAFIDKYVMTYLLNTEKNLVYYKDSIIFNEKPFAINDVYVCLRKKAGAEELVKKFDAQLSKIDVMKIQDEYFAKIFSD